MDSTPGSGCYVRNTSVISGCRAIPRFFSESLPSFPHVHTLSAKIDFSKMSQNLIGLSRFPAVEVLTLDGWEEILPLGLQASDVLPVLRDYTGPTQTLHIFLPLSTLRRIETTDELSPTYFISQLKGLQPTPNVTSLDVRFEQHFSNAAFNTLCVFFAQLTELRIRIVEFDEAVFEDGANTCTSFLRKLAVNPTLPPTLKCLTLHWRKCLTIHWQIYSPPLPCGRRPNFTSLRGAISARCPDLISFWIDGDDFLFSWNRWPDGTEEECIADNKAAAKTMREEMTE